MNAGLTFDGLGEMRAVVTGGAGGIGLATVRRLADLGAKVVILDQAAKKLDDRAGAPAGTATVSADVSDLGAVRTAFAEVDRLLGGIDLLVANAGISERRATLELTPEEWRRMLDVNLSGVFFCAQEAARRMDAGVGGVILMTASTNGLKAHPGYAHYNAAKAGVIALARTMALELAPKVRVNAVCPGYVDTPMQTAEYTQSMLEEVNRSLPLGRHATPDEVAGLFAYLSSDQGRYITGQAVVIDGGELA